ncbi:MAG: divalent-cation tolerance protein CutA [Acidobacteria bacterium]|nr:MAG: divalent-cation tolerance protein CutA [Acidobacteriota bacterium]
MIEAVIILTTVPDAERGGVIARRLVEERLAACVNVCPAMTSFYRWKGAVERADEHQLVIKTERGRVPAIASRVRDLHPYELPEFLVLPIVDGDNAYLDWLAEESRA